MTTAKYQFIRPAAIRRLAKENGRRVSPSFLAQVEASTKKRILFACHYHNGGKVTLDQDMAVFAGFKVF